MKYTAIVFFILLLTGCGGGSDSANPDGNSSGNTTGTVTLSGNDTGTVGTQLDTGFVGTSVAAGGQPDYIVIVDKASNVTFTPPNTLTPDLADSKNGFVLVVTDAGTTQAISMSILVNGNKYDYACTTPIATFTDCGTDSIILNIGNKTVTFNNVQTANKGTGELLTLDGSLTW